MSEFIFPLDRASSTFGGRSNTLLRTIFFVLAALLLCTSMSARADEDYLDPDAAFHFSARMLDASHAEVHFAIADGYYMYRERLHFKATGATLGSPELPPAHTKYDDVFKKNVDVYRDSLTITLPVQATGPFTLIVESQGCADKGLCYAPMESQARLSVSGAGLLSAVRDTQQDGKNLTQDAAAAKANPVSSVQGAVPGESESGRIEASLNSGRLVAIVPLFILLGLGLAFTPCVLPMVPILSSIIVGDAERASRSRSFLLALSYSLGMALVYTLLGVAAGLVGQGLSAALQNPWVLTTFALLIAAMSLSMFGFYQLQLPAVLQTRLASVSGRQSGGKVLSVAIMGAISALIVGPCVAAPLAGVLLYISQTRNAVIGGSALFSMAIGMSIPLLAIGLSAGALLPRAGAWMEGVKRVFGVLLLGMALWIAAPVWPRWLQFLGWALLGLGYGVYLLRSPPRRSPVWPRWLVAIACLAFSGIQLTGLLTGAQDPLDPLAAVQGRASSGTHFIRVKSVAELDAALARSGGKPSMLDFYADWCISCKEMEKFTFSDARVKARLAGLQLLQADVTANNADDQALLRRFHLFGPPGIIFFDGTGTPMERARVIGFQDVDRFLKSIPSVAGN